MKWLKKQTNLLTLISGISIAIGFFFRTINLSFYGDIFLIIATLIASIPIVVKTFLALKMKTFSIELLVVIAVVGAVYLQEYVESSMVTFLFLFGAFLEVKTLNKTRQSLQKLLALAPEVAWVERAETFIQVDVKTVKVGDVVLIKAGEKIPVDGHVIKGEGMVVEAMLTGEPMPSEKGLNSAVFSGTLLEQGYIKVMAEKVGASTVFSRIIALVEEAQETKTKAEKFIDRFAKYYTPAVIFFSIIVFIWTRNLHQAISFLVVACPGALVIGAPISLVAGIGNGARHGILFKGGEVMEVFARAQTLLLDKTGTITKGRPTVNQIMLYNESTQDEVMHAVASLESYVTHPLAAAILDYAKEIHVDFHMENVQNIELFPSQGVGGMIAGAKWMIGTKMLLAQHNVKIDDATVTQFIELSQIGNTVLFVAKSDKLAALIIIADQLRPGIQTDIATLKKQGIKEVVMLTGDQNMTAKHIATLSGIDSYVAEMKPEDKANQVRAFQRKNKVVMVGDGINDAPALALADVGIAMGNGGSDIAMETADIVLMGTSFKQLVHAYHLSKATMANLYQNLAVALFTVIVLLLGVVFGVVHLAIGMFVHEASVLLVIINAMRLLRYRVKPI